MTYRLGQSINLVAVWWTGGSTEKMRTEIFFKQKSLNEQKN